MPDLKITQLTSDAAPTDDDLLILVNDPSGTPGNRQVTVADFYASAPFSNAVAAFIINDTALTADSTTVAPSQHSVKSYADAKVVDDATLGGASTSVAPSQASVIAYVASHVGGGGIATSDTTVKPGGTYWSFVLNESDLVSNSATKLPTQASVKSYVDALPTITTNDTLTWPVTTVGGVTTIDLSAALSTGSSDFADSGFRIHNAADATALVAFSATGITTGTTRTITIPDRNDTMVTLGGAQTLAAKTLNAPVIHSTVLQGGITFCGEAQTLSNDFTRSNMVEFIGSTSIGATLACLVTGGTDSAPTQTTATTVIGRLTARGYTGSAFSTNAAAQLQFVADEAVTSSVKGSRAGLLVTPLTTNTAVEAQRWTSDSVPQAIHRGPIVVNAGSGLASARTALAFDLAAAGGFGYAPATSLTYASPTSVDTTLGPVFKVTTVNATGSVTFNATTGGVDGQMMVIRITNDATSGKTITFGTNFKSQATLVGTTSKVCQIWFVSDGTNWYECGRSGAAGGTGGM